MKLLTFQREAVNSVVEYYQELISQQRTVTAVRGKKPIDPAALTWLLRGNTKPYCPLLTNSGVSIANVALCIPTGGGKTVVGLSIGVELLKAARDDERKFIVWMVPSDAIYNQVQRDLSIGGTYHTYIKEAYGREVNIKTASDTWIEDDIKPSTTTILLLSFQSIIRTRSKNELLVYRNADVVSSLSIFIKSGTQPSLYGLLQLVKPFFIIDESHRYYTEIGRDFFRQTEIASLIVELSATHKQYSPADHPNIIFSAGGKTLIEEELIKKPIVYHSLQSAPLEDLLTRVIEHQQHLEQKARLAKAKISPKVLISSEFTGLAQSLNEYSAQNIKKILLRHGIASDAIAVKSSELDELSDNNLDDLACPIKYVITKRALMEGWDCKSVYTIVLVNKIGADTTNFQLLGRGLRQPGKRYFEAAELNELHVFTNSASHDDSVRKLTGFLSDAGLADSSVELLVQSDNRVLHKLQLKRDITLAVCSTVPSLSLDCGVVLSKLLESKDTVYEKFILSDPELPSIEEFLQKIDLSKRQPAGIVQGREIVFDELAAFETTEERLRRYLFTQLSTILPSTRYAFEIATKQVSSISNIDLAFRSRSELFLEMKKRIDNEKLEFQEKYFLQAILPRIMKRRVRLSESIGEELDVYASQDLALDQPFQHCLYGNVPKSLFNDEELEFARFIDRLPGVDWVRNPPKTGIGFPYAFGYFYPDFILFSSASRDRSFSACFIETKGEHLTGNRDSESKKTSIEHLNKILVDSKIVFSGFDAARTFAASFASG